MAEKGWNGADLVFDLDADHLPGVDPETASYTEMLAACKGALEDLLDVLTRDFGVRDDEMEIVFSGGRGYHVHVRREGLRGLDSAARREIVDYVRGVGIDEDGLMRRVHERLVDYTETLREMPETAALERLQQLDGVGEKTAQTIYGVLERNPEGVREGNVELGPGAGTLVRALAERVLDEETAPIDEPVTTDVRRLIRLPGSLHGGTGFVVRRLDRESVAGFEPTRDAVADRFRGQRVMVDVTDPGPVPVDDSFRLSEGTQSVREFVGVFLLARGRAEKTTG
jgi:DNA primase small subunit